MAKSQKKSNREVRKPKQEKPKVQAVPGFLGAAGRSTAPSSAGKKR